VRDANASWKQGIPAVVLVHEPFATLARAQCQALGAKDPVILVYKQDAPARDTVDETVAKAGEVAAEIVLLLSSKK
jgi:hypothetical protein